MTSLLVLTTSLMAATAVLTSATLGPTLVLALRRALTPALAMTANVSMALSATAISVQSLCLARRTHLSTSFARRPLALCALAKRSALWAWAPPAWRCSRVLTSLTSARRLLTAECTTGVAAPARR
eukprot:Rmarinus@m.30026